MRNTANDLRSEVHTHFGDPGVLAIFEPARLQAYGYALAIVYAASLVIFFRAGGWLIDRAGYPLLNDFVTMWIAGHQALQGNTAPITDPVAFTRLQQALVGQNPCCYPNWPYPPVSLLYMKPFATLPYMYSLLMWNTVTLVSLLTVAYRIVRRLPAMPLVLASPFTFYNFVHGQFGFLTGSLLGGALLLLERNPVLAGTLVGCLTYKPQFGMLLPVALLAGLQWRAFASAAATALLLAAISVAAFGIGPWQAFPSQLMAQGNFVLLHGWEGLQTTYGIFQYLGAGATLSLVAQGAVSACIAVVVWCVWRSSVRYALKAAVLSTAVLITTPYAYNNDLAVIALAVAFLASDQLAFGTLRGEQTALLGLFGLSLLVVPGLVLGTFAVAPIGAIAVFGLLALILRRISYYPGSTEYGGEVNHQLEASRIRA